MYLCVYVVFSLPTLNIIEQKEHWYSTQKRILNNENYKWKRILSS